MKHPVPKVQCAFCKTSLDAAFEVSGEFAPRPNDIAICIHCGGYMVYTDDLMARAMTDGELAALSNDDRMMMARTSDSLPGRNMRPT